MAAQLNELLKRFNIISDNLKNVQKNLNKQKRDMNVAFFVYLFFFFRIIVIPPLIKVIATPIAEMKIPSFNPGVW